MHNTILRRGDHALRGRPRDDGQHPHLGPFLFSTHVAVARRLQAEADEALQGRTPTSADLPKLLYTRMVIDESCASTRPAWITNRRAIEADTV